MPTSRSRKRAPEAPAAIVRPQFLRPLLAIVALVVVAVIVMTLPASTINRFLPPGVHAEDFSGSVWHGSAGSIRVDGRDAGAVEWHLHPLPLFRLMIAADLRWVKVGFVADGSVEMDRQGVTARNVRGGGPIEDLKDFGVATGWRGAAHFQFRELKMNILAGAAALESVTGDLAASNVASPQIANGAELGGYALHLADGATKLDAAGMAAIADLSDTGGPLEVRAVIHYDAQQRTGMLSGTIKARTDASPMLRSQIDNLEQLHARDAAGRIPVELEFTF